MSFNLFQGLQSIKEVRIYVRGTYNELEPLIPSNV